MLVIVRPRRGADDFRKTRKGLVFSVRPLREAGVSVRPQCGAGVSGWVLKMRPTALRMEVAPRIRLAMPLSLLLFCVKIQSCTSSRASSRFSGTPCEGWPRLAESRLAKGFLKPVHPIRQQRPIRPSSNLLTGHASRRQGQEIREQSDKPTQIRWHSSAPAAYLSTLRGVLALRKAHHGFAEKRQKSTAQEPRRLFVYTTPYRQPPPSS